MSVPFQRARATRFFAVAVIWLGIAAAPMGQESIEPDRPDITNSPHLVGVGVTQFEIGGIYARVDATERAAASPIGIRVGLSPWFEARLSLDGWLRASDGVDSVTGFGNVQLGAKIRVWPDQDGRSRLSVGPSINLPSASLEKGLGTGRTDFSIAALTGVDIGRAGRLDLNYAIGAMGASDVDERFTQHLASASMSVAAGERWSSYGEVFAISRDHPDGSAILAINTGALYAVGPRLILDGGVQFGVTDDAPSFAAFAGFSVAVGGSPRDQPHRIAITPPVNRVR